MRYVFELTNFWGQRFLFSEESSFNTIIYFYMVLIEVRKSAEKLAVEDYDVKK